MPEPFYSVRPPALRSAVGARRLPRFLHIVFQLASLCVLLACAAGAGAEGIPIQKIIVPPDSHPAFVLAAKLLAQDLSMPASSVVIAAPPDRLDAGELLLTTNAPAGESAALLGLTAGTLPPDGYGIIFANNTIRIYGQRPRSLLFAAGDVDLWRDRTNGIFLRHPAFAFRSASAPRGISVAESVARLGVNVIIGPSEAPVTLRDSMPEVYRELDPSEREALDEQAARAEREHLQLAEACHEADVEYFPLLYGNDFRRWSPMLYAAALKVFPSARGTNAANSWEKGSLCPSDPDTWKLIRSYVREFVERSHADGLYVTFWDHYGIYCQCSRCAKDGLDQFSNELYVCLSNYDTVTKALGCKLVVRTWSSGAPHWFGDEWVHAPGNGGPSGAATQLWGKVIHDLSADLAMQSKVYASDCQPDPPFSDLLGHAAPHQEIAEFQITGQTTGRLYLPASTVDYTAMAIRRSYGLIGPSGGVSLFCGATKNPGYNAFADIVNSINLYAWHQLSWNPQANVEDIWLTWARRIFGEKAAPYIVNALRRSESVIDGLFSPLGLGNDTNSGFPGSIARRESLLKYTNRYYRPEGQAALEPTLENVNRVVAEKEDCLRQIAAMQKDLDEAAPYLKPAQLEELRTRLDWLQQFALVERYLDESLWRYRYLRYQNEMLSTDPGQMQYLANAWDQVRNHYRLMFRFDPGRRFSCYQVPLGELPVRPSLGSPLPLMIELYRDSLMLVEQNLGPASVPSKWLRGPGPLLPADLANKNHDE